MFLGLLCDGNPSNQAVILRNLPGSSRTATLDAWITTINDFAGLYADLAKRFVKAVQDAKLEDLEEDVDENAGAHERQILEAPFNGGTNSGRLFVKDAQGGEKGVELANRVIKILQNMRSS